MNQLIFYRTTSNKIWILSMIKFEYNFSIKELLLLMSLIFTPVTFANETDISLPFTPENTQYWQYLSDRVMGGVSNGQVEIERDGDIFFARMKGNVSTENNGGFIQLRSGISFENAEKNGKQVQGVRLNVRGNGETYNVFIRTTEMQSYSDYYSASFKTNENWEMIDLPFNKFKRKRSKNSILDAKDIRTFSIVAYGRDFTADVSVSTIEFYY